MQEINKIIIKKFLKGKASEHQVKQVEDWYAGLGDGRHYGLSEAEMEEVGQRIYGGIKQTLVKEHVSRRKVIMAAAAITLLVALGSLMGLLTDGMEEYTAQAGQRARIVLSDGSEVILNENTTITYPTEFLGETRRIQLDGEAFFSIARDEARPFIVAVNDLDVRVLGTKFNVNARNTVGRVKVTVEEGSVAVLKKDTEFSNPETALAVLKAEEQLIYNKVGDKAKKVMLSKEVIKSELVWRDEKLVFRNNTLFEITESLKAWYNVEFRFVNPDLKGCVYTANLDSSLPIEQVLELLRGAQNFEFTIENGEVRIDGRACNN